MNKQIMNSIGSGEYVQDVEQKKCPMCKNSIHMTDFKDKLSVKEFGISGLCQECQNKIFG